MSQTSRLREHLDSGKTITRLEALTELGIFELSARIIELKQSGYNVAGKMIRVVNRFGEECRVKEYRKV